MKKQNKKYLSLKNLDNLHSKHKRYSIYNFKEVK